MDPALDREIYKPSLPPEIILHIVKSLISPATASAIALPASDPISKTLLSLTLTCRTTYGTATRLLYSHCLFIDSEAKLSSLLASLHRASEKATADGLKGLRPPLLQHITSLYLCPGLAQWEEYGPVCQKISDLFTLASPSLRRLVFNYDFVNLPPAFGRDLLLEAFSQLTSLEFFCSIKDDLYTYMCNYMDEEDLEKDLPVWSRWPKLKKLALWGAGITRLEGFWGGIGLLKELQELVLIHPDDTIDVMDARNQLRDACWQEKVLSVIFVDGRNWVHEELLEKNWGECPHILFKSIATPHFGPIDRYEYEVTKRIVGGEELVF
jgi:hypothetical protein